MSSTSPEQVREQIEITRARLSGNVDTLADTVNPGQAARRQVDKVRGAVTGVREKVMGTAAEAGDNLSTAQATVTDAVTNAPDAVLDRTAGNPLAAGLIMFGIGWLTGSLLPDTSVEQQAASSVKDVAAPVISDAAKEIADHLKEPAQEATQSLKDTAAEAIEAVKDDTADAAQDVKDQVQHGAGNVQQ